MSYYQDIKEYWIRCYRIIIASFYSGSLYREVVNKFRGNGVHYLAVISLIVSLSASLFFIKTYDDLVSYAQTDKANSYLTETIDYYLEILPEMHWDGNKLTKDSKEEVIIKSESGKDIILVDLHNKLSSTNKSNYFLALTSNNLEFPKKGITLDLSFILGNKPIENVNKDSLLSNINTSIPIGFVTIMSITVFLGFWFSNIFFAALFAAIIVFIGIFPERKLDFRAAMRLCCYSFTPALILEALIYLCLSISLFSLAAILGVLYQIASYGYIIFAYINATFKNPSSTRPQEE